MEVGNGGASSASVTVEALRLLSVFTANQGGAYRELAHKVTAALGPDIETKLRNVLDEWAKSGAPGLVILTGNAGTGKTAAVEAYCSALGAPLPNLDAMVEVKRGREVVKDLSGLPHATARAAVVESAISKSAAGQVLMCANEGVLRDAFSDLKAQYEVGALEVSLRHGAYRSERLMIINLNRQRPTSGVLWNQTLDYLTREDLWLGCPDCPFDRAGCPMRSNAEILRHDVVREQLRTLFQLATGEAVPTLRQVLAILSWAIVGDDNCQEVRERVHSKGRSVYTAAHAYFSRVLGGGLRTGDAERSPLLMAIQKSGLGDTSDLQVDGWLRDIDSTSDAVKFVAGHGGTKSPLDRVRTDQHEMTFAELGEMVSTDEDPARVEDGLIALVNGATVVDPPAQSLWRQRVFFEASLDLGGYSAAARRLLRYGHIHELVQLARRAASGEDTFLELTELVRGLNFLVTGFASPAQGLIVPDPACLFSRDPGAFRPPNPSLVHNLVRTDRLSIEVPDKGLVRELLDVDDIDVDLVVDNNYELALRISPRMYEAIREAADYRGPVGQGIAEMNDLRVFYGQLAQGMSPSGDLQVADPKSTPPALVGITLPRLLKATKK
jgi:hypothetical protein